MMNCLIGLDGEESGETQNIRGLIGNKGIFAVLEENGYGGLGIFFDI